MTVIRLHLFDQEISSTRVFISLLEKVSKALAGLLTIGSPLRLKEVLSRTGTSPACAKRSINIGVVLEQGIDEGCDSGALCHDNQNSENEKTDQHGRQPPPFGTPKE